MDYKPLINTKELGQRKRKQSSNAKRNDRIALVVLVIINVALAVGLYNGAVMRGVL